MTAYPGQDNAEWVWEGDLCHEPECYLKVKLVFDGETRTARCPRCGDEYHYEEDEWVKRQILRNAFYNRAPGTYFFKDLPVDEIVRMYLRELSHDEWCDWFDHDYGLARVKGDNATKEKLKVAARVLCDKMDYELDGWLEAMKRIDGENGYLIVPEVQWRRTYDELKEAGGEDEMGRLGDWRLMLLSYYRHKRAEGDVVACWVTAGLAHIYWIENEDKEQFREIFLDPFPTLFNEKLRGKWKGEVDPLETAIRWKMNLAEAFLNQDVPFLENAVIEATDALAMKLGLENLHTLQMSAKDVLETLGNDELLKLYEIVYAPEPEEPMSDEEWRRWISEELFFENPKELLPSPEKVAAAKKFVAKVQKILPALTRPDLKKRK